MAFLLVLLCLSAGYLLRRAEVLKAGAHYGLNTWLVYVAVPAAALYHVPHIVWTPHMLWPVLMPALVWAGSWLVLGRLAPHDRATQGALILGCGLGNTSFVGFPLTSAYFGEAGLKIAVVCDQITFLLLSTVGVATSLAHGQGQRQRSMVVGMVSFPPFLGFVTALLAPGVVSYGALPELWKPLADTLVPVALFSVGAQLEISGKAFDRALGWGLLYKLLLAPALILALLWGVGVSGLIAKVTVLEAAMASMATTSVLAVQYGLNTRISSLLIGVGVPLSLLTTYLWYRLAEMVF
jgi:predicted permease